MDTNSQNDIDNKMMSYPIDNNLIELMINEGMIKISEKEYILENFYTFGDVFRYKFPTKTPVRPDKNQSVIKIPDHWEYGIFQPIRNCSNKEFELHYRDTFFDGEPDPVEYHYHRGNVIICMYEDGGDTIRGLRRYNDCEIHNFDDGGIYLIKDGHIEYLHTDDFDRICGWKDLPFMIKCVSDDMSEGNIKITECLFTEDVNYWITIMKQNHG